MGVTPDQLIPATDVEPDDLLVTWRGSGPLKGLPASLAADFMSSNATFAPDWAEAISRPLTDKVGELISVKDFGAVGDGVTDDTQAFRNTINFAAGRPVHVPEGDYLITERIDVLPAANRDVDPEKAVGAFAPGLWLVGDGMTVSRIHCQVPNDSMFYLNVQNPVPYAYRAQQGARIANLAIVGNGGAVPNCTAFEIYNAYQLQFSQVHIRALTGTAIKMVNGASKTLGSNPFSLVNGNAQVVVTDPGHGRLVGYPVLFSGVTNPLGGLTLNATWEVTGLGDLTGADPTNKYRITAGSAATSTVVGGGSSVIAQYVFDDGWNCAAFESLWIESCGAGGAGWAIDATGTPGRNEGSFTHMKNVFIQGCGRSQYFTVTGITNANPAVLTLSTVQFPEGNYTTAHPFVEGDKIKMFGVTGMTQANDVVFTVGPSPTAKTLVLYTNDPVPVAVDSSAWGVFTGMSTSAMANDPFATSNGSATVVVTSVAHGQAVGNAAHFAGASAVGGLTINGAYRIAAVLSPDTYTISAGVAASSTATGGGASVTVAYQTPATIGAEIGYYEPRSGGLRWKGQLLKLESCGFTVNYNCAHYVPGGAGSAVGMVCEQVTWENNYRRHIFVKGGISYYFIGCQFHGNNPAGGLKQWRLAEFDASENTIQQVLWQNTKVRAKECPSIAFKFSGANLIANSCRVRGVIWSDYDYVGQQRFSGAQFDPVVQDLELSYTSATLMTLRPHQSSGTGNKTPLRLRGPNNDGGTGAASTTGEWVAVQMTSNNGLSAYNTLTGTPAGGALANNTVYNMYLWDDDGALTLQPSTTAPVIDTEHGYMVMTGDATKLFVGRAQTDGSAQWSATASQFLNPLTLSSAVQGQDAYLWYSDIDRKLRIKTSAGAPTSMAGGTYDYWPTLETSVAFDPPSIAAGATATQDVTVVCGAGDYCSGVGFSLGWGGLTATGCVKAANTVTVTMTNPTGGTIDLASGSLRVAVQRR